MGRVNRNLKMVLVGHTVRHKDWDAKLPETAYATRATVHRSTGFTPGCLSFGRGIAFPGENTVSVASEFTGPTHTR